MIWGHSLHAASPAPRHEVTLMHRCEYPHLHAGSNALEKRLHWGQCQAVTCRRGGGRRVSACVWGMGDGPEPSSAVRQEANARGEKGEGLGETVIRVDM